MRRIRVDYYFIVILLCLISYGLVMLYSASYYSGIIEHKQNDMFFFIKQAEYAAIGLVCMFIAAAIPYRVYRRFSVFIFIVSWILMLLVLSPLGNNENGARRWLVIGPVSFQPSELAKVAVVLFIPVVIVMMGREINSLKGTMKASFMGIATSVIIFIGNDHLSSALIVLGITFLMIFAAQKRSAVFIILVVGGITALVLGAHAIGTLIESSGNFRLTRLLVWLNPEKYADSGGYQVLQGLYAIGSGGLFGKGLGNSSQKLGFIPESENDMILAIIGEELGVFGILILLFLFCLLLHRMIRIAAKAEDMYSSLVVLGIFGQIALQVILNICVVLSIIPNTGITLPFFSYGGTALIIILGEMGIVLSVDAGENGIFGLTTI